MGRMKNAVLGITLASALLFALNSNVRKGSRYYSNLVLSSISADKNLEDTTFAKDIFYTRITDTVTSDSYNIVSIPLEELKHHDMRVVVSKKPLSIEALVGDGVFGINASFYQEYRDTLRPMGLVHSGGRQLSNRRLYSSISGYFIVDEGAPSIEKKLDTLNHDIVLQSYPLLIFNSEKVNISSSDRTYRSAVALDARNLYFITTDNKPLLDKGVTFDEFQNFLISQGYIYALNLDGGKSTQMIKKPDLYQPGFDKIVNAIVVR